ncbi:MAG: hypothetical protein CL840_03980 [Crocinitomicaceae bacterium]|nr:hypothetical protein [Crocinitomicaceae bacterium]|tara:strand:+ start:854 stop:1201 length:348 start_codon:yes stop_codon:yes gene_type:complete
MSAIEITPQFWQEMETLIEDLAIVEHDLTIYTEGLSALEKKLMKEVDERQYHIDGKRLPEYLQRREAKADSRYNAAIRAKAGIVAKRTLLKGKVKMMEMQFDEWRTRSANKRGML